MGNMGWLLLDGALVILTIVVVVRYVKMGLAQALVNFIGILVAAAAAVLFSSLIAQWVFSSFIREPIVESVQKLVNSPMAGQASQALRYLPAILLNLLSASYGNNLGSLLQDAITAQKSNAPEYVADEIVSPAITPVLATAAFLVLFLILVIIVKLVSRAFQGINEIPLVGPLNMILGGMLGLIVACVLLSVLVEAIGFLTTLNGGDGLLITKDLTKRTYLYRFLTLYNPLELLFHAIS